MINLCKCGIICIIFQTCIVMKHTEKEDNFFTSCGFLKKREVVVPLASKLSSVFALVGKVECHTKVLPDNFTPVYFSHVSYGS